MKTISEMSIGELAAFVCDHLYRCGIGVTLSGGGLRIKIRKLFAGKKQ